MKLINLSDCGIKCINYYWERREKYNISEKELASVGVTGNDVMLDERLIPILNDANSIFKKQGYEIIVKDGYRSPELYQLVFEKRCEYDNKENTHKTLSLTRMPHATGLAVDINLVDTNSGKEVEMRRYEDWPDGIFLDFYRNKKDPKSIEYQRLQDLLVNTMLGLGLKLGKRKEFHHFELEA